MQLADLREQYSLAELNEAGLAENPVEQFRTWLVQAVAANIREANAMTLATVSPEGLPTARMVLLKDFDQRGFVFYTNYESPKARDVSVTPYVALVFYWAELQRQVRIAGTVSKISRGESEAYFQTRPPGSQLGAWISAQSTVIPDRSILDQQLEVLANQYAGTPIPVPPFWGGFRVSPETYEFWQGRPNRLHDRIRYRQGEGGSWVVERLSP